MGVSGDGVQQFVDRLVDEDHHAFIHCGTFWRRQARGQEVPSAATARVVVRQMIGPLRRVSDRSTEPAPVWAPRVRGSVCWFR
jgi:hypothetical protein